MTAVDAPSRRLLHSWSRRSRDLATLTIHCGFSIRLCLFVFWFLFFSPTAAGPPECRRVRHLNRSGGHTYVPLDILERR